MLTKAEREGMREMVNGGEVLTTPMAIRLLHALDTADDEIDAKNAVIAERDATIAAMRKSADELIAAMETCHICEVTVIVEDDPVHCEDCSWDCDSHEEPNCPGIGTLHRRLKALLQSPDPGSALMEAHAAELIALTDEWQAIVQLRNEEIAALRQRAEAAEADRHALARAIDPMSETPAAERSTESLVVWCDGLRKQVKAAEAALEAIKAEVAGDAARVDWRESHPRHGFGLYADGPKRPDGTRELGSWADGLGGSHPTYRAAIDAAMQASTERPR